VAERETAGARLLVVDDNKVNRLLLGRLLEQLGYRVDMAENGRVALERLHADAPDLVLLDIEMPELDGYGLLERIRGDLALRDLPVIVTSSNEGLDGIVRCIELGAEDYLAKPVNPTLLRARLRASLEKKRLRDQQKALVRRARHARGRARDRPRRASRSAARACARACCSPTSAASRRCRRRSRRSRRSSS
jgi:CheY-like chemotaxis protein